MTRPLTRLTFCLVGLFLLPITARSADPANQSVVVEQIEQTPLTFTQNNGQWPDSILFRASAREATIWFTDGGVYYQFTRRVPDPDKTAVGASGYSPVFDDRLAPDKDSLETMMIKASFVEANPNPRVVGLDAMEYKCNYFLGNDQTKWRTDVPNYSAIVLKEIYPGIDLTYYGNNRQMEYDFVVSPGADYSQIRVQYDGARALSVNGGGELVVETEWGTVTELTPTIYQIENGEKKAVRGEYCLLTENSFGFHLDDSYNPGLAVTIDPVLSYSTYLGGDNRDHGHDIVVDAAGAAYLTGVTYSTNFPTANPYDAGLNGHDIFVTKFSSAGNSLDYSTYLGGTGNDTCMAIAINGGRAYLTGYTASNNFPTVNPYDAIANGGKDVFVAVLSSGGNSLDYSTYLGGTSDDAGLGIAVGGVNNLVYITGWTVSNDFPKANAYDVNLIGYEAFVTKLSITTNILSYSTYLGGSGNDVGADIAVDTARNACIIGYTSSTDFPTASAYDASHNGDMDNFVTKLNATGTALIYSTYLGGSGGDWSGRIALDSSGAAYVTGNTNSTNYPTLNAFQGTYQGPDWDAFVTKFSTTGSLQYSTYLGGSSRDIGFGIAVNAYGKAYVTGYTSSPDFPMAYPYDASLSTANDIFVTRLSSAGNSLLFSTYLGGNGDEHGCAIAVDIAENAYIAGFTRSTDFPTANAYDANYNGDYDIFLTKLNMHVTSIANLDDNGWGSFRAAIDYANANPGVDTILFSVSGTIALATALPAITAGPTVILGSTAPGGVHSVILDGSAVSSGDGLLIQSYNNKIEGLTIRNFPGNGIKITGASNAKNTMTNNLIYMNNGLGIDLGADGVTLNDPGDGDTGPNDLLNYPEIDSVISGMNQSYDVYGHAAGKAQVELFVAHPANQPTKPADPSVHGEAYIYVGADTCNSVGGFAFTVPSSVGHFSVLTATTIDTLGNTSEFSVNFPLIPRPLIVVAYSPVNTIITDPDGLRFGKDSLGNNITGIPDGHYFITPNDSVVIDHPITGNYIVQFVTEGGIPTGAVYSAIIMIDGTQQLIIAADRLCPASGKADTTKYEVEEGYHYKNGDANRDNTINIGDAVFVVNYIFKGGPAPDPYLAGDANCDQVVNIGDAVYVINYIFKGGHSPCYFEP